MSILKHILNLKGQKIHVFFGDSITMGVGASNDAHRWSALYCAAKGDIEENHGVSGSPLQNSTPLNPTGAPNFRDAASQLIPTYIIGYGKLFISYGTNDVGLNLVNFTAANYKQQLKEVISIAISKNWPLRDIIVESPSYYEQSGRDGYVGLYGVTIAADLTRHEAHVLAANQACLETGVVFDDSYAYMKNNGGASLLRPDGLHPNDAGHLAKATHKLTL
jgi:lysophospholipase L1-like esterase